MSCGKHSSGTLAAALSPDKEMAMILRTWSWHAVYRVAAVFSMIYAGGASAEAQTVAQKPNIILLVSDDTGWGDLGVYGGGKDEVLPPRIWTVWHAKGFSSGTFTVNQAVLPGAQRCRPAGFLTEAA